MGFPQKAADGPTAVAFVGADCVLQSGGFTCPRCKARVLDLPSTCHVCGLTLVSSSQLARSYHHLFPVKPFVEISSGDLSLQVKRLTLSRTWGYCEAHADSRLIAYTHTVKPVVYDGVLIIHAHVVADLRQIIQVSVPFPFASIVRSKTKIDYLFSLTPHHAQAPA